MIDKSLFSLSGIRGVLLLLVGFAALTAAAIFGQAWSLANALTNLWLGQALPDQFMWIAFFLAAFISVQLIAYLQDLILDRYAYMQADMLRQKLITTVFTKGPELVQASGTGNTTTMLLEGVEQVEIYLRLILQKIVRVIVIPSLLLIPAFILDWISGIILVLVFPFIILYMTILGKMASEKAAKQHRGFQILSNHFIDSLRGIDTLKFFGMSKKHGKNIFAVSEKYRKATIKTLRVATLSSAVLDLFSTLSLAAVAIMLGLRLLDGSLVLLPALTILVIAPEYFKPIREFASDFHASLDGRNALASILKMIGSSSEKLALTQEGHLDASLQKTASSALSKQTHGELSKEPCLALNKDTHLAVNDLCFSYNMHEVLHKVSFDLAGCTKVGIIGASGAGKSTLIKLLSGFSVADSGSIRVNGQEVLSLQQAAWQKQLAYLPQDPYIFHATLRENISFYCPDASDEEIARAVTVVGLQSLVDELSQGLETKIGEGERALSGGQAQRVALARICLDAGRSILLFDEPTAHLDIETELELKQRMLPLMQGRTVFFATHRLHWMHNMDTILVMDGGTIVESGTLEELRARKGYFSALALKMGGGIQ